MNKYFAKSATLLSFLAYAAIQPVLAQTVWVSDEFEITLRTGPSTNNAIERMLTSGTRLEILETDADSGYTRVRTDAGTEGWVLSRYLMSEPPAREQLQRLTSQLTDANAQGSSLSTQLNAIESQHEAASRQLQSLQEDKAALERELADIRRKSANVLAIDTQNQNLQQQLADAEIKVGILEQENETLASQKDRNWFITGALVLFGGILVGLIVPRIKFQKRSRYDRL